MIDFLTDNYLLIFSGLETTLFIAFASLVLGIILAFTFALMENAKFKPLAWFFTLFVMVIRGLPELIVVLSVSFLIPACIIYLGEGITLPQFLGGYELQIDMMEDWYDIDPIYFGIIALALLYGAYASQTLRGAFKAVPQAQRSAAYTLGIGKTRTFFSIVVPQIWQHALPGLSNQWLVLLKDTALVSIIGTTDLLKTFQKFISNPDYSGYALMFFLFAALIYLAIAKISQLVIQRIECYAYRYIPKKEIME